VSTGIWNQYPLGAVVQCPFYFANRELTATETSTFLAGGGLPAGVGVDPASVLFHYKINGALPALTATTTKDATGLYHAVITPTEAGDYEWQGYGQDGGGNAVAAMSPRHFLVLPF
jgi:hypothetical protein